MSARIIVEYRGNPSPAKDDLVDRAARECGLEPGDTGYSFIDRIRDHNIEVPEGQIPEAYRDGLALMFASALGSLERWVRETVGLPAK